MIWQFTPVLYSLPKSTLDAMIMDTVFGLISAKLPLSLFRESKINAMIQLSTFVLTLILGLKTGILTGMIVSFIAYTLIDLPQVNQKAINITLKEFAKYKCDCLID